MYRITLYTLCVCLVLSGMVSEVVAQEKQAEKPPATETELTPVQSSIEILSMGAKSRTFAQILALRKKASLDRADSRLLTEAILREPLAPALHRLVKTPDLTYARLIEEATPAVRLPWVRIANYMSVLGIAVASQGEATTTIRAAEMMNQTAGLLCTGTVSQLPQAWVFRTQACDMLVSAVGYTDDPHNVRYGLEMIARLMPQRPNYGIEAALQRENDLAPLVLFADNILPAKLNPRPPDRVFLEAQRTLYERRLEELPKLSNRVLSSEDLDELKKSLINERDSIQKVLDKKGSYMDWLRSRVDERLKAYSSFRPDLVDKVDQISWDMLYLAAARKLYELEKGRPAELKELVPDYIPELPKDPFDPDGGTYRISGTRVYSLGYDGKDSQGLVRAYYFPDPDTDMGREGDLVLQLPSLKK